MTNWRICPECNETFIWTHPMAIWHGKQQFCSRQCREARIRYLVTAFQPLHDKGVKA